MITQLVEYLEKCDDAYYNTSNPIVSDDTYDAMVESLRRLRPDHPYLSKVGAKVRSNKIGRVIPMGTLSKCHKDEEVKKWLSGESGLIIFSPKYDGFAVELVYQHGKLVAASTRGTGVIGEDVYEAALNIQSIPKTLEKWTLDEVIVRGEAIIPTINHGVMKSLGYNAMRNAVPGIVRSNRADALKYVDFVAYEFIDGSDNRKFQRDYWENQFIIEDYRLISWDDFEDMQYRREELRASQYIYELDGVVLKTNNIKEDNLLNPEHMISWKYKSNRETTVLRGIEYSMGVTGYFTPIGIFDEVEFQGAKLTRASLGNMTRLAIDFEGLTIGSMIEVSRRGDIIPYIEDLVLINEEGEEVNSLTTCPHCGSPLSYDEEEPHCVSKHCPEKLRLQISQYVRTVGIKGIGDALVRGLIDAGYINELADIYKINPEVILSLPRQGQSSVEKWKTLQEKRLSFLELLTAYPFIDLGKKIWEILLTKFSREGILSITEEDLNSANIRGIGESKIKSIVSQIEESKTELASLIELAM